MKTTTIPPDLITILTALRDGKKVRRSSKVADDWSDVSTDDCLNCALYRCIDNWLWRIVEPEPVDPFAELKAAHARGERIQECSEPEANDWTEIRNPQWYRGVDKYRIAPKPKLRPWRPKEVPVGAIARLKEGNTWKQWLITARCDSGIFLNGTDETNKGHNCEYLFNDYEHSTDHGLTWQPCGVLEQPTE